MVWLQATARDVVWLTDLSGKKLSDKVAADVAERVETFMTYCAPSEYDDKTGEYKCVRHTDHGGDCPACHNVC